LADLSETAAFPFVCEGGLVLNQSTFIMKPGQALELENFEPDIEGGYRRISGFSKYVSGIVPITSDSSEEILMVATFADKVVAARGTSIYQATPGGSSWTSIDSGRTSAGKYSFERFNFDGNDKLIVVDGTNDPTVFNTSLSATDITTSSVEGSKFVAAFKNHMFYAGKSTTPQEVVFSEPFDEDGFNSGQGAGSIKVDDTIVGLKVFRDNLFIFCENRIFKLGGSSSSDFAVVPVTRNIGCINGNTIQEFAGDLIFLGPDGLRTIAGTARIGDVELGTISANVQSLFDKNISSSSKFESIVIPDKTQYRIFFSKDSRGDNLTEGVICVMRGQTFEFSKMRGIKPTCTDTFVSSGDVIALHGSTSGYIQRQESGNDFDGTIINGKYRSPDLTMNDPGIRKHMQKVVVNYAPESSIDADLFVRYDYESRSSSRPAAYPLDSEDIAAIYGTSSYGTPTYGGASQPLVRQAVEGSGFAVALRVNDGGATAPYSIKGFQLEYQLGARR